MKTKMKTIISVCMLTVILYACTKDTVRPESVYDCMRIENGTAIIDDCGDCHKWLAYNLITHATREVNDTINEVLDSNEIFTSPNNLMNPDWNACPDCNGISNGPALFDTCRVCRLAFIYDFINHKATFINDTTDVSDTLTPMQYLIGMPDAPENPYWNNCDSLQPSGI